MECWNPLPKPLASPTCQHYLHGSVLRCHSLWSTSWQHCVHGSFHLFHFLAAPPWHHCVHPSFWWLPSLPATSWQHSGHGLSLAPFPRSSIMAALSAWSFPGSFLFQLHHESTVGFLSTGFFLFQLHHGNNLCMVLSTVFFLLALHHCTLCTWPFPLIPFSSSSILAAVSPWHLPQAAFSISSIMETLHDYICWFLFLKGLSSQHCPMVLSTHSFPFQFHHDSTVCMCTLQ